MVLSQTEQQHEKALGIDTLKSEEILNILLNGQFDAIQAVRSALPEISLAANLMAESLASDGSLVYAAAGSSALMGLADGLELPGTFGISQQKIKILIAGGQASLSDLAGSTEDDSLAGERDARIITPQDCLIAISASGTTPYPLAVIDTVRQLPVRVIGISNTPDTPLLEMSDVAIYLPTPAEVIAGSTRLGAGSAQKVCLNLMSTLMGIHLGHVYDGFMVNLLADNMKLKQRAAGIVSNICNCTSEQALELLNQSEGSVKVAVLLGLGAGSLEAARQTLEKANQNLRQAIALHNQVLNQ